ncbi:hypothetical protein E2C01_031114 [Portunus trituberculatus]|uniref:Uncharacterized protein n=1 Tax=Portunus trituberculatus TaxID=210409 RepID=A0A5B7EWT1_PORTR|nr:hypothetical protein [Portunus trituberculatus]
MVVDVSAGLSVTNSSPRVEVQASPLLLQWISFTVTTENQVLFITGTNTNHNESQSYCRCSGTSTLH